MKLFYIAGPHCAGKTSILKRLKEDGIIDFNGFEIGKEFYYQRQREGFKTEKADLTFEKEVAFRELERDKSLNEMNITAAVETWHPGNLAYVMTRNPQHYQKILSLIKKSSVFLSSKNVKGIVLKLSPQLMYTRTKTFKNDPGWAVNFYTQISYHLQQTLEDLKLIEHTTFINADLPLDEVYENTANFIIKEKLKCI